MYQVRNVWRADRQRAEEIGGAAIWQLYADRWQAEAAAEALRRHGLAAAVVSVSLREGLTHGRR